MRTLNTQRYLMKLLSVLVTAPLLVYGCGGSATLMPDPSGDESAFNTDEYLIGPGDAVQVYVWDNQELTVTVPVRPDGLITIPLVEDMKAVGKTPTELARDIETSLSEYVRTPKVNVIVTNFRGTYRKQIRVVGQAVSPQALSYQSGMTLLDVMIGVGGLTAFDQHGGGGTVDGFRFFAAHVYVRSDADDDALHAVLLHTL